MIQTQVQMKMETLYERLEEIGLSKKFVRERALPDWWNSEFEDNRGAVVEAAAYISRRLNLDINSLLEPSGTPTFKQECMTRFKAKRGVVAQELYNAYCIAARVAEMAAVACTTEFKLLSESAAVVRNKILESRDKVDLEGLLQFLWSCGIPVVYFDGFPKSQDNFGGMVTSFNHRPVIVISLNQSSRAWLAFILAYELGHIIKGDASDTIFIDKRVLLESLDVEEVDASVFARELLLGKPDIGYNFPAYVTGEGMVDAEKEINIYARQYLDLDKLDVDSQDYLELAITE
jgi:Zn-dependent peptidase ImmA (M78 family)